MVDALNTPRVAGTDPRPLLSPPLLATLFPTADEPLEALEQEDREARRAQRRAAATAEADALAASHALADLHRSALSESQQAQRATRLETRITQHQERLQQRRAVFQQALSEANGTGQTSATPDGPGRATGTDVGGRLPAVAEDATGRAKAASSPAQPDDFGTKPSKAAMEAPSRTPDSGGASRRDGEAPRVSNVADRPELPASFESLTRAASSHSSVAARPGLSSTSSASTSGARGGSAIEAASGANRGSSSVGGNAALVPSAKALRAAGGTPKVAGNPAPDADPEPEGKFDANVARIVRSIKLGMHARQSNVTMRLDPPHLGNLRVRMELRASQVEVRVEPTTRVAHELLRRDQDALRTGLEASGLQVERIEIVPPTESGFATGDAPLGSDGRSGAGNGWQPSDAGNAGGRQSRRDGAARSSTLRSDERRLGETMVELVSETRVNVLA